MIYAYLFYSYSVILSDQETLEMDTQVKKNREIVLIYVQKINNKIKTSHLVIILLSSFSMKVLPKDLLKTNSNCDNAISVGFQVDNSNLISETNFTN